MFYIFMHFVSWPLRFTSILKEVELSSRVDAPPIDTHKCPGRVGGVDLVEA